MSKVVREMCEKYGGGENGDAKLLWYTNSHGKSVLLKLENVQGEIW